MLLLVYGLVLASVVVGQEAVDASTLRHQADKALQTGNNDQAVRSLTSLIALEPNRQINYYKRSVAYLLGNRYDLAEHDATKAIELDQSFAKAYLHRGKIRRRVGNCVSALQDFQFLSSLDGAPKDIGDLIESTQKCQELAPLAEHLHKEQNWGQLKAVLQELTQIVTNSKKYLEWEIEALLNEGDYETLIATAGKLLLFDKNNMYAYLQRGNAYLLTGNEDMAIKYVFVFDLQCVDVLRQAF
jgi:tetratricopeptide (TPR) repeat protein